MANRNQNERDGHSRDREQPEGWFDPEQYRNNLDNKDQNKSAYQQTSNPNMVNRYDDLNRQRMQNNFSDRNAFDRQYGNGRDDSRNPLNETNNPSAKYGDSFDEGYSARGNQQAYRDNNHNNMENRQGMTNRFQERGGIHDQNNNSSRGNSNRNSNQDRDWWDRASDEVSSWFGDDDAERRRRMDKVQGPHSGKGPKGYTRSDEKLKDDINERLYHDSHIDASDVDVTVENGEVTLSGTVENKMAKRRIEDILESIPGVRDVENRLKAKSSSSDNSGQYSNDKMRGGNSNSAI